MYYLRGLINFNDQVGFLSFIYAGPDRARPESDARSLRRLQGTGRQVPEQQIRAGFDRAPELPDQRDGVKYEVHVANYYYRRGAYLAALNRAQGAVTDYAESPAREEALFIMIRCYDKLGMFDLRDDTQRVFTAELPEQPLPEPGKGSGEAPWWKFWAKSGPKPAPKDVVQ
jgi:outer membrane protein assembly factor BamD